MDIMTSGRELTIPSKIREICELKPSGEAFISFNETTGRQSITFADFYTLSRRFAYVLKNQLDVKTGEYVVISLPVAIETAVATFGIVLAGAVPVSLEITFKSGEALIQALVKIRPRLMIIRDEPGDNVFNFLRSAMTFPEDVKTKNIIDVIGLSLPRVTSLATACLVSRGGDGDFLTKLRKNVGKEYELDKVHGGMSAFMHFTTGTVTDCLKMTEMTHEAAVRYCESLACQFIKPFDKFLYINGWFWVSGMPFDIFHGVTRCIPDDWVPCKDFGKLLYTFIRTEGIRFADVQPIYLDRVMELWEADHPDREPLLDLLTILGMPITKSSLLKFRPLTRAFNLVYGSHECGANHNNIVEADQVDRFTDFDCGFPMPGVQSMIVDQNWKPVTLGSPGRLLLKTPGMFRGYPNEPDRSARCFNEDGWFVTNDRAFYDKDTKHLMVGGRIDSIILHGEYMVHPTWIEDMLSSHPFVERVVSVPVPDEVLFHSIGVCVIKRPGCELTKDEVQQHMLRYLFPEKIYIFQVKHLLFFHEFPLREDGSVDRSRLFDIVHERTKKGFRCRST